jgi:ubiquinol-cytochrome c reductase cytochrome b subunit
MKSLLDWLDDRTGYRWLTHEALDEPIPGGARWRYVWGSTLVFTFVLQVITGLFLWTAYSPSVQTAWESVYFIQHEMFLGRVLRGTHHFAAQAMVVLLGLHLLQVVIDGAYRSPREVNFWLGLILAQIVLALALTGYLLPWDQKGYYATQVSTKIVGAAPAIGPELQRLIQGGPEYGHHTLTRFFAMHAGFLPALLVLFLVAHLYVFRRHGLTTRSPDRAATANFWPDQLLRDAVACLAVLAIVLLLAIFRGAELSAPANPAEAYSAARPEWYFLSLFRFLRFEAVEQYGLAFGAIYVPLAVMAVIVLMPFIAWIKGGHAFNVIFMCAVAIGVGGLTAVALIEDRRDTDHQAAVVEADRDAHRIVELAQLPARIPVEGAGRVLGTDPFTQGPRLFAKHCASCHRWDGHDGRGRPVVAHDPSTDQPVVLPPSAPELAGFAGREWWTQLLTNFEEHFAPAARSGYDLERSAEEGMVSWFRDNQEVLRDEANKQDVMAMAEYLASLSGNPQLEIDQSLAERGQELLSSGELSAGTMTTCDNCHASVGDEFSPDVENAGVPELNGFGSQAWLNAFLEDPGHEQFFGDRNMMPSFAGKMSDVERELLIRYLTGDYSPSQVPPYPRRPAAAEASPAADQ